MTSSKSNYLLNAPDLKYHHNGGIKPSKYGFRMGGHKHSVHSIGYEKEIYIQFISTLQFSFFNAIPGRP